MLASVSLSFGSTSLLLGTVRHSRFLLDPLGLSLAISFLQGALAPFRGEWFSETKILILLCSLLLEYLGLRPPQWTKEEHRHTHTYLFLYLYVWKSMSSGYLQFQSVPQG